MFFNDNVEFKSCFFKKLFFVGNIFSFVVVFLVFFFGSIIFIV